MNIRTIAVIQSRPQPHFIDGSAVPEAFPAELSLYQFESHNLFFLLTETLYNQSINTIPSTVAETLTRVNSPHVAFPSIVQSLHWHY